MAVQASGSTTAPRMGWPGTLSGRRYSLHVHQSPPPPPSTLLNHLFRQVVNAAVGASEFWLQAHHGTRHTHPVALLQHETHLLAAHGATAVVLFTAPLLPLLRSAALATSDGLLLLNVPLSVAHLHDQALVRRASRTASWDTTQWSDDAFHSLLLDSSLPRA